MTDEEFIERLALLLAAVRRRAVADLYGNQPAYWPSAVMYLHDVASAPEHAERIALLERWQYRRQPEP